MESTLRESSGNSLNQKSPSPSPGNTPTKEGKTDVFTQENASPASNISKKSTSTSNATTGSTPPKDGKQTNAHRGMYGRANRDSRSALDTDNYDGRTSISSGPTLIEDEDVEGGQDGAVGYAAITEHQDTKVCAY